MVGLAFGWQSDAIGTTSWREVPWGCTKRDKKANEIIIAEQSVPSAEPRGVFEYFARKYTPTNYRRE